MTTRQAWIRFNVAAGSLLILAGCSGSGDREATPDSGRDAAVQVTVSEIQPWQQGSTRQLPGVVRPGRRAVLSTRVSGTIHSIGIEAGDHVVAGDELARVESRDVAAVVAAAESQVKAAEAAHDQAVRDVERLQRLAGEDLIARNRLEHARVKQREAGAMAEKARAELRVQRINRRYANISAPFDGIVSEILLDEGTFTGPGQPVLILEDRSSLRIDVPVSSRDADFLASSERLSIVSPLLSDPLSARYVATVPAFESAGAGQRVRLSLENPPAALLPGQVVDVLLPMPAGEDWVALPRAALIRRGQLTGAMVIEQKQSESVVRLRWIRTADGAPGDESTIPVSQGLSVGEHVVLHPSIKLRDGQPVQPERGAP